MGGLAVGGLSLTDLLRAREAQASESRRQTSAIFFYQSGGASHLDMVDMKPQAVPGVRGPFAWSERPREFSITKSWWIDSVR